jgi:hypothetical protein
VTVGSAQAAKLSWIAKPIAHLPQEVAKARFLAPMHGASDARTSMRPIFFPGGGASPVHADRGA